MRKIIFNILILTVLLLFQFSAYGQNTISGIVLDNNSKNPIEYVNIMIEGKPIGASTDKNGSFSLDMSSEKKILISCLGYKSSSIAIEDLQKKENIIYLKPSSIALEEVLIGEVDNNDGLKLNSFKKRKCNLLYSKDPFGGKGNLWVPFREKEPTIEGVFFPSDSSLNKKNFNTVQKIEIYLNSYSKNAVFRVRLFNVDSIGKPLNDIVKLPLQYIEKGDTLLEIDIQNNNIEMPKNGLFIGVELIMTEQNITNIANESGEDTNLISPFLYYLPTHKSKNNFVFYRFTGGVWEIIKKEVPNHIGNKPSKKVYKPAISLILNK